MAYPIPEDAPVTRAVRSENHPSKDTLAMARPKKTNRYEVQTIARSHRAFNRREFRCEPVAAVASAWRWLAGKSAFWPLQRTEDCLLGTDLGDSGRSQFTGIKVSSWDVATVADGTPTNAFMRYL